MVRETKLLLSETRYVRFRGDAAAQTMLGMSYAEGKGIVENDIEAVKWFRRAAEQGDPQGQLMLGLMLESGLGVQENDAEALKWVRKAAG